MAGGGAGAESRACHGASPGGGIVYPTSGALSLEKAGEAAKKARDRIKQLLGDK